MNTKKVTFYILKTNEKKSHDLYACRLIEKIYQNKHKIYINVPSSAEAENINTQLWTFRDISFIPHEIYNMQNQAMQILIGYDNPPAEHNDILLNMTTTIPAFYINFVHVIEIITDEPNLKKLGRERYKIYQQQNFEIVTHEQ